MTANLYDKNGKYHVMLSWYERGKRKQKSIATGIPLQGNNKRIAEAARKRILSEWEAKITDNYQDVLFSDYLKEWLKTIKHSIAETTYHAYSKAVENQICPYFAEKKIKLNELKPIHIQTFYNWKLEGGKNGKPVTGNTIRHYHANIHRALKDAVRLDQIKDNPADRVILPKKERYMAGFYTASELNTLLNAVKGSKLEIPVYIASLFGLRRGEVCGLRWSDINLDKAELTVNGVMTDKGSRRQTENLTYRASPKTSAGIRSFPISSIAMEFFLEIKRRKEESRKLMGNSYNTKWLDYVCVDEIGNLIQPEYISYTFPKFLLKHRMRKINFHDLRHTNISLLVNCGVDMKRIQSWAGHADFSVTANTYAHLLTDAKRELSEVICNALT